VVDLGRSFYQQVTPLSSLRHTPEMSIARFFLMIGFEEIGWHATEAAAAESWN
jgi:hypothetical protein